MIEYGNAIKDLVAANIFPGDMLWKNFGVTRNGKVVFYDYDEIEYLTDCNFRKVPQARNEEEEMSGEVWYTVGPKDVFPETFEPFLLGNPAVREVFMKHHADLLDAAFWQSHKERIQAGHVHDVFPYEREKRFARRMPHATLAAKRRGMSDATMTRATPGNSPASSSRRWPCRSPSLSSPGSSARSATTRRKRTTSCCPTPTTTSSRWCWPTPTCTCEPTSRCRIPRPSRTSACW